MKRVYIDEGFGVSSTALLRWISEFEKKKHKIEKTYSNASNGAQILMIRISILTI